LRMNKSTSLTCKSPIFRWRLTGRTSSLLPRTNLLKYLEGILPVYHGRWLVWTNSSSKPTPFGLLRRTKPIPHLTLLLSLHERISSSLEVVRKPVMSPPHLRDKVNLRPGFTTRFSKTRLDELGVTSDHWTRWVRRVETAIRLKCY
jgi:hypothetical protein